MKKFSLLFLLASAVSLTAQETVKNSLLFYAGPNVLFHKGNIPFESDASADGGVQFGLQYAWVFAPQWEVLAGIQHNRWRYILIADLSDGISGLPSVLIDPAFEDVRIKSWQYYSGLRWSSRPQGWRFQAELLCGATQLMGYFTRPSSMRLMTQIGAGPDWSKGNFSVFLTPSFQYVFREIQPKDRPWSTFSIYSINSGCRLRF